MNNYGKNVRQRILASALYHSGQSFGALRMSREIDSERWRVVRAMTQLVDRGQLIPSAEGTYCKPTPRHWIHSAALNDARSLRRARVGA